jgi:hypothetical protein
MYPPSTTGEATDSVAHLTVPADPTGAATPVDSNTLNVVLCNETIVQVFSTNYTGDDGSFFVQRASDAAATVTTRILADIDGDGVISDGNCPAIYDAGDPDTNDTGDCVPLDGDDGSGSDGDSTDRQTSAMYGITEEYIRVEQVDKSDNGAVHVKVICK